MAFYFRVLHFGCIVSYSANFCLTRALTTENVIFWVLNFDTLIYTNIPSQLVPRFSWHNPGHSTCRCPIYRVRDLWIILRKGKGNLGENRLKHWQLQPGRDGLDPIRGSQVTSQQTWTSTWDGRREQEADRCRCSKCNRWRKTGVIFGVRGWWRISEAAEYRYRKRFENNVRAGNPLRRLHHHLILMNKK